MKTIRIEEIDKNVEDHKCPEYFWCTVATTCYELHERERMCLRCWLNVMKEKGVEILYEQNEK